ncbi:MAG: A24 family peptidase [Nocardioides sp.]
MDSTALAVLVGAVVAGAGSALVPRIIAAIPEPEPHPEPEPDPEAETAAATESASAAPVPAPVGDEPVVPLAEIAEARGLAWRSAVAGAVAGGLAGYGTGWHWAWAMWVPLVPAYVALAVVDWRRHLLPTYVIARLYVVVILLALVGWAVTGDTRSVVHAGLGWLVAGFLYGLLWFIYPRGLGFGDVRLSGVLGIALGWLGWGPLLIGVYAGFLIGGVGGGLLSALRVVNRKGFPFGPFMLIGALVGVLWGEDLWSRLVGG